MKCANCGKDIPINSASCPICGSRVRSDLDPELEFGGPGTVEGEFSDNYIDELEMKFSDGVEDWSSASGKGGRARAGARRTGAAAERGGTGRSFFARKDEPEEKQTMEKPDLFAAGRRTSSARGGTDDELRGRNSRYSGERAIGAERSERRQNEDRYERPVREPRTNGESSYARPTGERRMPENGYERPVREPRMNGESGYERPVREPRMSGESGYERPVRERRSENADSGRSTVERRYDRGYESKEENEYRSSERSRNAYGEYERSVSRSSRPIERRAPRRSRGGGKGTKVALIGVIALLVLVVAAIVFVLKGGLANGGSKPTEVSEDPNSPGKYFVTAYGPEGGTMIFEDSSGNRTEAVISSNGKVNFSVHTISLLPTEPIDDEKIEVVPKVFLKTSDDAEEKKLDVQAVEIIVPKINISFDTPEHIESSDGVVTISGKLPDSQLGTKITVSGEDVQIGEDGAFSYSVKRDMGEYSFELEAALGGHAKLRKTFTATVTQVLTPETVVTIPESFVTRALNVEDSIRVQGTVPVGTTLSVASDDPDFSLKSQPEVDDNGNFSFVVNLPKPAKCYRFVITARTAEGSVFERKFSVERPPVYNEYVPTVWSGTYSEMSKPVHVTDMRGFLIKGTVSEILYDGDYTLAKLTLEDSNTIEIEYHDHYRGASELNAGEAYTMFGYSLGTADSGTLRMFIWFVQDRAR